MSEFAMPTAVNTYRHASWCTTKTTVVDEDGDARCDNDQGSCLLGFGDMCSIFMDNDGQTVVAMEMPSLAMSPQEMLARCLEGVQAAMLAGAVVR